MWKTCALCTLYTSTSHMHPLLTFSALYWVWAHTFATNRTWPFHYNFLCIMPSPPTVSLVLGKLTNPFFSKPCLPSVTFSDHFFLADAITTESSAYSTSQSKPTWNSLEIASVITIVNIKWLRPEPWCNPNTKKLHYYHIPSHVGLPIWSSSRVCDC